MKGADDTVLVTSESLSSGGRCAGDGVNGLYTRLNLGRPALDAPRSTNHIKSFIHSSSSGGKVTGRLVTTGGGTID